VELRLYGPESYPPPEESAVRYRLDPLAQLVEAGGVAWLSIPLPPPHIGFASWRATRQRLERAEAMVALKLRQPLIWQTWWFKNLVGLHFDRRCRLGDKK